MDRLLRKEMVLGSCLRFWSERVSRGSTIGMKTMTVAILASVAFESFAGGIGEQRQPLVQGIPTNERPEVGFLVSAAGGCTATMISSQCFLTAAHCVKYDPVYKRPAQMTFTTDTSSLTRSVDMVFSQGGSVGWDDIAIGRLDKPVPYKPAELSAHEPRRQDILTVMGYGCTDRRTGTGGGAREYREYAYLNSTSHYCPGDSGGPVFRSSLTSRGPIVRVNSGYEVRSGSDIGANTVRLRQHILSMVRALEANNSICYRVHVQGKGWMPAVCNGEMAGTTGENRRIEAIQIWSNVPGLKVQYRAHLQGNGWTPWVEQGDMAGTIGQSRRLEALEIKLAGNRGSRGITYQAHVESVGWQNPATEGKLSGTTGKKKRMEAIRIWMN